MTGGGTTDAPGRSPAAGVVGGGIDDAEGDVVDVGVEGGSGVGSVAGSGSGVDGSVVPPGPGSSWIAGMGPDGTSLTSWEASRPITASVATTRSPTAIRPATVIALDARPGAPTRERALDRPRP